MKKDYLFVGIDLGTSSLKLGISDSKGKVIYIKSKNYPLIIDKLCAEQKSSDWWNAIITIFKEVPNSLKKNIKAISFSGQMHGMVLMSNKGEVLRNPILWNDMRTHEEVKYLNETIGVKKIAKWTSNKAIEGFTLPKILWIKKNEPKIFEKIHKILLPKDFLIYQFTNKYVTDHSDASGTLYYDVRHKKWAQNVLKIMDISESQLPIILNSYDVVGKICQKTASILGLKSNVLIVAGGADNAVAALSLGVINQGDTMLSIGTSGVLYINSEKSINSENVDLHNFVSTKCTNYQMGVTISAGESLKWFVEDVIKDKDKYDQKMINEIDLFNNNTPLFHPYILGERTPINDPKALGSFVGISRNSDELNMIQAIMEGVAFSFKEIIKLTTKLNIEIKTIKVIGGGANLDIWCKIIASTLNKNIARIKDNNGPFYGAIMLAMIGAKMIDFMQVKKILSLKYDLFKPDPQLVKFLKMKFNIWQSVYPLLKKVNHELNDLKEHKFKN